MGNDSIQNTVVSIILPTHNRANLLEIAVNTVIDQSFQDWELLVIDDISTDNTEELMNEFSKNDSRIQYIKLPVDKIPGITKYLNYGIKIAKGKYIARIDDDDFWVDKDKLKVQVEVMEKNTEYVLTGGGVIIVDENRGELHRYYKKETDEEIRKFILSSNPFLHSTIMFTKVAAEKVGLYHDTVYAEDWDMWLRLGKIGKLYNFPRYFAEYMSAGQNKSFTHQRKQSRVLFGILKEFKHDYPGYPKGFVVTTMQYLYSFLPVFFRKRLQSYVIYLKRKHF